MSAEASLITQIKTLIVDRLFLDLEPEDIAEDADLMQTYNLDSVNLFEIVMGLEEEFGLSLEDTDFCVDTFANVRSIAEFVTARQS